MNLYKFVFSWFLLSAESERHLFIPSADKDKSTYFRAAPKTGAKLFLTLSCEMPQLSHKER